MNRQAIFDEVIDTHGPALWRLTAGYARQHADRNDLYQEILLAVWRALPSFRGDASLRTFVLRIGHNRGLTFRARSGLRSGREQEMPPDLRDERPLPDAMGVRLNRARAALSRLLTGETAR